MICKKCKQDVMATLYDMCLECYDLIPEDNIVQEVVNKYQERSKAGYLKYGTTLDRKDLTVDTWLKHLQEELMDATVYIQKLRNDIADATDIHFKLSEQGYFNNSNDDDPS